MKERVVLITGASRGIGAATARAFAGAGYRVAAGYHTSQQQVHQLAAEFPGQIVPFQADVSSREQVQALFEQVEEQLGPVEILVCNAGIAHQELFTQITPQQWQQVLDVNLSSAFHCCQMALPSMIRRRWGRIITVSSMWGQVGASCEVAYSAAKAGLIGLTRALAKEEGPSGITVNCVAPGVIETDMMQGFSDEDKEVLAQETAVGSLGTPMQVAQAILFLASEQADYITGQVLGINGGMVM